MSNIAEKLFTALSGVAALGTRVYPSVLPQAPTYPCAAYQFISNPPAAAFIASARMTDFNAQVTLHTTDYASLQSLRSAVFLAVEAMPEHVVRNLDIESTFEFETKTYTWLLGFQFRDFES